MEERKIGRPSKYISMGISEKLKSVEGWARHGSTNAEIAEMLGIRESTLYAWKKQYPEFSEALRVGARESNGEILHSAFDQATGYYALQREVVKLKKIAYETEGESITMVRDARGNPVLEDVEKVVEYEKYYEADPRMTMFMLINRLQDEYKQRITQESKLDTKIEYVFDTDSVGEFAGGESVESNTGEQTK